MKKILLSLIGLIGLSSLALVDAQTFTVPHDTVTVFITNGTSGNTIIPDDPITNTTAHGGLTLKWHVVNTNFPANWQTPGALGICDNVTCYSNTDDTLWNEATTSGSLFTTAAYGYEVAGGFNLSLTLPPAASGCYYLLVNISDPNGLYSKLVYFNICNTATAVPVVPKSSDNILLYPNPASNDVNVVFDASSDVKNIAIYNIIGKMMTIYKVNGTSANLNLDNVPSGIYFVRLINSHGDPVATRKFTKQ